MSIVEGEGYEFNHPKPRCPKTQSYKIIITMSVWQHRSVSWSVHIFFHTFYVNICRPDNWSCYQAGFRGISFVLYKIYMTNHLQCPWHRMNVRGEQVHLHCSKAPQLTTLSIYMVSVSTLGCGIPVVCPSRQWKRRSIYPWQNGPSHICLVSRPCGYFTWCWKMAKKKKKHSLMKAMLRCLHWYL